MLSHFKVFTASVALLFVLVAGPAMSGETSTEFYGKLHVSVNAVSNSEETGTIPTSNASHLGFKGSYEVNERFAAIWQIESGFNTVQKEFSFGSSRNTFAGLRGKYGTVLMGIHDAPLKTLGRKITYFEDSIGDFRSTTMGVDARVDEIFIYALPQMENGLGGQFSYMFDQGDWTNEDAEGASAISGMVFFAPQSFLVGVGFQSIAAGQFNPTPGTAEAESVIRGVGRYEKGKFGISALFQAISNYRGADGISATTAGIEGMFSISQQWLAKAGYYQTDPNTDLDDDGFAQLAIGVDHQVEQVTLYAQYAVAMNDDNQTAGLGNNEWGGQVLPSEAGKTASGISLGLELKF